MVVGFAGNFRDCCIFDGFVNPPEVHPGQNLYKYMIKQFVPSMKKVMDEHDVTSIDGSLHCTDATFLVAINKSIFRVFRDYSVIYGNEEYASIGSGKSYALGSLYSTEGQEYFGMSSETRIRLALRAAEKFCPGVQGPFDIMATNG